ncbi:MAG: hypothetical protein IT384_07095 [Deltaproteobacteria bacterium]|nr:hypothetical protein [Deltaproteobacteria bacterium]
MGVSDRGRAIVCFGAAVAASASCLEASVLPPLPLEGDESMVAVLDVGGGLSAHAIARAQLSAPFVLDTSHEGGRIAALLYPTELAELGLTPGSVELLPIALGADGRELTDRRPWPAPAHTWTIDLTEADAWRREATLPSWVSAARIRRTQSCTLFTAEVFALPLQFANTTFALPIDADSILLGEDAQPATLPPRRPAAVLRLGPNGVQGPLVMFPAEDPVEAVRTSTGTFVVVTSRAELAEVRSSDLEPRFRTVPTATTTTEVVNAAARQTAGGLEILAWTHWSGGSPPPVLLHLAPGEEQWSVAFRRDRNTQCTPRPPSVVWLDAERALLAWSDPFVYEWPWVGDQPSVRQRVPPGFDCVTDLFSIPGVGVLAAAEAQGEEKILAIRRSTGWEPLLTTTDRVKAVAHLADDRLLLGLWSGAVQELILTPGGAVPCPPVFALRGIVQQIVPVGARWLVAGSTDPEDPVTTLAWLDIVR